jgi:hypothetical protein
MVREITLARGIWDLLKPLESNADTINVARHLQTQFQLAPPKPDVGIQFHPVFANPIASQKPIGPESSTSPPGRSVFSGSMSPDRSRSSLPQALVSPVSPGFRRGIDTPRTEFMPSEDFASGDGLGFIDTPRTATGDFPRNIPTVNEEWPTSPGITTRARLHSTSNVSFDSESLSRRGTVPLVAPPEKGMSKWRSKLSGSKKESSRTSGESSSISSTTTLESQKVEEIPLKNLISGHKLTGKGKGAKNVNVSLCSVLDAGFHQCLGYWGFFSNPRQSNHCRQYDHLGCCDKGTFGVYNWNQGSKAYCECPEPFSYATFG